MLWKVANLANPHSLKVDKLLRLRHPEGTCRGRTDRHVVPAPWHQPTDALSVESHIRRLGREGAEATEGAGRGKCPAQALGGRASPRQSGVERVAPKQRVKPAQRRAAVAHLQERFGFSQRRAYRLVSCGRSTIRYQRRRTLIIVGPNNGGRSCVFA